MLPFVLQGIVYLLLRRVGRSGGRGQGGQKVESLTDEHVERFRFSAGVPE